MTAENRKNYQQRDSVERQGYAGVPSLASQAQDEQGGANLLEEILDRDNLNRAYKRVKHGT